MQNHLNLKRAAVSAVSKSSMIEMRQNAKLQAWHTCKLDYKGYGTRRRRSTCQSLGSFGNLSMDAHNVIPSLGCSLLQEASQT